MKKYRRTFIFVVKNSITGGVIHYSLFRRAEFWTRLEAVKYIKEHNLDRGIYYPEMTEKLIEIDS